MQYVNLGKTGMKVSRLCLGMMTYGSTQWRDWVLTEEQAPDNRKGEARHFAADIDGHPVMPVCNEVVSLRSNQVGIGADMVSVKKWEEEPPLMVMDFAFRMKHALAKNSRFHRRDWGLSIIVLIGHNHMFDVGGVVEHIEDQPPLP